MLLVSWNVAGLGTTANRIHEAYSSQATASSNIKKEGGGDNKNKKSPASVLAYYLERHQVDILCVQESKIPKQQLSDRCEPRGVSSIPGYESFWCPCLDSNSSGARKGFNGVATFAKCGTVLAADAAPLGIAELDQQGRCVMTDHGSFLLFNVYVPCSGGSALPKKMRFLRALQKSMQQRRAHYNKPVILVGDLNIAANEQDTYWKSRVVYVNDILNEVDNATIAQRETMALWKLQVAEHWKNIEEILKTTKEVTKTQTTNPTTKAKFDKYRLSVRLEEDGKPVFLGKFEEDPKYCLDMFDFDEWVYHDEEIDEPVIGQVANTVPIAVLTELMGKLAGVEWTDSVLKEIALQAVKKHLSPTQQWLNDLLQKDDMVDVFRSFYPTAQARFTCWNQLTNLRYKNVGARIDYILVDRSLLQHAKPGPGLRCCLPTATNVDKNTATTNDNDFIDPLSEQAAIRAATANGRFQPVGFEGGGMQEPSQEALDTQFGPPHTGMIYTPPTFSDHIAVSVLFDDAILPPSSRNLTLNYDSDPATRRAQPHKKQQSIASFFGSSSGSSTLATGAKKTTGGGTSATRRPLSSTTAVSSSSTSNTASKKSKILRGATKKTAPPHPPSNSILNHFQRQSR